MKKTISLLAFAGILGLLAGCSADTPQGTEQDKANLDRLSKEGIGGPPPADGSGGTNPSAPSGSGGGVAPSNAEPLTP